MKNQIRWLGHAAFEITSAKGRKILIDPWISGNPACPLKVEDLATPDLVLITHDHQDHYGIDIPVLLEKGQGILLTQPEVIEKVRKEGVPEEKIVNHGSGMNIGGTVEIKEIKVTMTQATHSSGVGSPCGFIVTLEDGKVIYHAGDTGIFSSMELFGELYNINVALLPIGSVFVMDSLQAATSLKLLKPRIAIPMHYKTFPILEQSADKFVAEAKEKAPFVEVKVLKPGEHIMV
ncbi:MAG: metal-dependent hydrolase [Firmicutes bacterium]|nr:metal-dependent hydrolase [Bacillota bacterium]